MQAWHEIRINMPFKINIPFALMPGSWGLKGKTREIAQAEYELSGIELERRLVEIDEPGISAAKSSKLLDIDHKYGLIDEYEYEKKKAELDLNNTLDQSKRALASLDVDLKHGRIDQAQYDRKRADILGEPWVSMPRIHWNPLGKSRAYFEVDYNEHFLAQLRENGYEGEESNIINQWMNDVCSGILAEMDETMDAFVTSRRPGGPEFDP